MQSAGSGPPADGAKGLDSRLLVRAAATVSKLLIKLRHVLDHAFTRFLREKICRSRNWWLLQEPFPSDCVSESALRRKIAATLAKAAQSTTSQPHVTAYGEIDVAGLFPDAWRGLCETMSFHPAGRDPHGRY